MNYIKHLNGFFDRLSEDERMSAYHVSLYLALFRQWNLNRFHNPFPILREELMEMSRIGSKTTYARCIKELHQWGYISYSPSGNRHTGRQVICTLFDTAESPESGTGTETGSGTRTGTSTGTRSGTLFINDTNSTKRYKQHPRENFIKGERKIINGMNRYHASNDKDFGEPL